MTALLHESLQVPGLPIPPALRVIKVQVLRSVGGNPATPKWKSGMKTTAKLTKRRGREWLFYLLTECPIWCWTEITALASPAMTVIFRKKHPVIHSYIGCCLDIFTGALGLFQKFSLISVSLGYFFFYHKWAMVLSSTFLHLLKWTDVHVQLHGERIYFLTPTCYE